MSFLRALRARPRLIACVAIGVLVYLAGQGLIHPATGAMVLVGWNTGAILYLMLVGQMIAGTGPHGIRQRALSQDEGRMAILVLVVLAAAAVILAAGTQLAQAHEMRGFGRAGHLGLTALTVITAWMFTQVLFALHYAHDFYTARILGDADPLVFPGTPDPVYMDFIYFACVIGTSGQTADVSFNGPGLRTVGTLHCIVAFFFNASLLALSINLAAGVLL